MRHELEQIINELIDVKNDLHHVSKLPGLGYLHLNDVVAHLNRNIDALVAVQECAE